MNDLTIQPGDHAEIQEGSWSGRTVQVVDPSAIGCEDGYVWARFTDVNRDSPFNEKYGLFKVKACTMSKLVIEHE